MRWWAVFLHQFVSTVSQDSVVICQDVNIVTSGTSVNIVNSVNSVKGVNSVNIASSSECIYFVNFWWQLAPWWQQLDYCTAVWQGGQRKKIILMLREGLKNELFTVRLTVRWEGGVSPVGPDRKRMWKFWPIFSMEYDYMILKTHFIVVGLKNEFLMPLTFLLYRYLTILWQSSSGSKEELGTLVVGWKWLFLCKLNFRTHRIIV